MHDSLSIALAERRIERTTVVLRQVVPHEGLSTIFVYTLEDLHSVNPVSPTQQAGYAPYKPLRIRVLGKERGIDLGRRHVLYL
jgi:hypothetical protein